MIPETVKAGADGLKVSWPNAVTRTFPWVWVRDHGEDAESLDTATLQRKVDTFAIDRKIHASSAVLDKTSGRIRIDWSGDETSEISAGRLAQVAGLFQGREKTLWGQGNMPDPVPTIACEKIMADDEGVLEWLDLIDRFGFSVITGMEATEEATKALAERIAPAQQTIFGTFWPLSAELSEHEDSAYTTDFLSPHTDATYYHNAAGLQMFNCIEFDGSGGESVVVDGFAIAEKIRQESCELYETLTKIMVPGQYLEPGVHLRAERPALRLDRNGNLAQVSFNNYDRAPFLLEDEDMTAFYAAYGEFNRHAMNQENWCKIPLRPGMALIFDNWRCLHGRMGYAGKRRFFGCYHNHAEYESRLRTLRAEFN
ncbi:hypothetical protein MNBD_ALPHA08-268 [hydrothermal vent metagenome]|uniref:TauD/TfdA-like domain-containing protein n=1 Tax=hydrothermal vent metagenome TaxID=652676 RepID=A0A3B0S297_9ZZZZ